MQINLNSSATLFLKVALGLLLILMLGRQLISYENWWDARLFSSSFISLKIWYLFLPVVILSVVVWVLEALRWKELCIPFENLSFSRALKGVLAGASVGSVSPGRTMQFGGKVLFLKKRNLANGVLQSVKTSLVTWFGYTFFAVLAFALLPSDFIPLKALSLKTLALICALLSCLWLYLFFRVQDLGILAGGAIRGISFQAFPKNSSQQLSKVLFITILKAGIAGLQYYLLLLFFGVSVSFITCFLIVQIIFFAQAVIPSSIFIDLPLRANLALFFFLPLEDNLTGILLAPTVLWFMNLAVPSLLGYYHILRVKDKTDVAST